MRRREIPVLIALFLDLAGFGMAFPDVQLRAEAMGASGITIGIILASLFAVQFVASPKWGILSDRIGRKPVVVACTLLSAASMIVYAFTDSLIGIFASRVIAGLAAANVVVAQAYLADTSSEEERAGVMGRIGAAISVGLIIGPFFGGQLVEMGGSKLLGVVAAGASILGAAVLAVGMKGMPPKEERKPGKTPIVDFSLLREIPSLKPLFVLATVSWFALACLEGTFGRLVAYKFEFPMTELGFHFNLPQGASGTVFAVESLIAFAVQGLLYGPLAKRLSFAWLLRIGYVAQGVGLLLTPYAPGFGLILVFSSVYSLGSALSSPTINTACSNLVEESKQGELFGLLQASRSVGFLLGPMIGGALFDLRPALPYVLAGAVALAAALLVPKVKAGPATP